MMGGLKTAVKFAVAAACASAIRPIELNASNFDRTVAAQDPILVAFYAPWCTHCKAVDPTLNMLGGIVTVGKCDGTAQRALASRFHVAGYPSIFFIRQSWWRYEVRKYEGSRSVDAFKDYVRGGYRDQAQMALMTSPYGPTGRLRGLLISTGARILEAHVALRESDYSAGAAALAVVALVLVALSVVLFTLVAFGAPEHPHAQ